MIGITWIHVAAGATALVCGAVAVAARKGGDVHVSIGTWFCVAMFVLGITAAILSPFKTPPDSPVGGIMVCYFVATAWMTARRRDGMPGTFEKIACAIVLAIAAVMIADGFRRTFAAPGQFSEPPSPGVIFALGGLCLFAGLTDLRFIIRGKLSATQRISRHLWRMCFAFFIATGSFFLGQQKVMPHAVRGSPILIVLALSPFAVMLFWLVRVRLSKTRQLKLRAHSPGSRA
jgi:hypothetical protein